MKRGRATSVSNRRRGGIAGNLLLAAVALLVGLLVCELLLRLTGISYPVYVWTDPIRGIAYIPGAKSPPGDDGRRWIEINSDGMRGPEVSVDRQPGTYRVALLGDSFMAGFEVPFEKTIGEVIEARLAALRGSPVEVLNFGVGGYGTGQELLTLRHKVWKYKPDMVLLAVTTGNDISDNYRPLKRNNYVPYFVYQGDQLVLDSGFVESKDYRNRAAWTRRMLAVVQNSHLVQVVNKVRHSRRRTERNRANAEGAEGDEVGLRDEVHLPPSRPEWQEAWRVTEGLLRLIRDECRKHDTPFAVVTLTRGIQVTPVRERKEKWLEQLGATEFFYPDRRLAEFGEREGIPVFNLAPPMAKMAEDRQVFFHSYLDSLGIGHWNPEGHRVAGELVASWLAEGVARPSSTASRP